MFKLIAGTLFLITCSVMIVAQDRARITSPAAAKAEFEYKLLATNRVSTMEQEMRELYVEGVAIHGDPESCVDDPQGRGEALTGARAGRAIEPRNCRFGVPTLSELRKATLLVTLCESSVDPARSENHGMYGTSMRENREVPYSPVRAITGRDAQGTLRRYA